MPVRPMKLVFWEEKVPNAASKWHGWWYNLEDRILYDSHAMTVVPQEEVIITKIMLEDGGRLSRDDAFKAMGNAMFGRIETVRAYFAAPCPFGIAPYSGDCREHYVSDFVRVEQMSPNEDEWDADPSHHSD